MGVIAGKIIDFSGTPIKFAFEFECGSFDLAEENGGLDGWVEINRDCDHWPATRRTLNPYASGPKGSSDIIFDWSDRLMHRKYFPNDTDVVFDVLDMSDVNGGYLPSNPCANMTVLQNMVRKIPCEGYTVDNVLSEITILDEWRVPGASYEVVFFAPLFSS